MSRCKVEEKNKRGLLTILAAALVMALGQMASAGSAPKVVKTFNPNSIMANEFVTLSISFSNVNSAPATFTAPFVEKLPEGVVILGAGSTSCGGKLTGEKGGSTITLEGAKIPAYSACEILIGVTGVSAGKFESKTPASALQTDRGNSTAGSTAILTVEKPASMDLRVKKVFNPSNIKMDQFTTLSIALHNPNGSAATFEAPYSDYLPDGMVILGNAKTTCEGTLTAKPGTSKVVLTNVKIPAYGTCEILLGATAPVKRPQPSQADMGTTLE